jgi:hypothetical protein
MLAAIRRLFSLPAEVDRLRAELAEHAATPSTRTHVASFWLGSAKRSAARFDYCPECGFAWAKGGPETHFNDPVNGERCPRALPPREGREGEPMTTDLKLLVATLREAAEFRVKHSGYGWERFDEAAAALDSAVDALLSEVEERRKHYDRETEEMRRAEVEETEIDTLREEAAALALASNKPEYAINRDMLRSQLRAVEEKIEVLLAERIARMP